MTARIEMPAPSGEPGNTYARGMAAVLAYLGTEVSYDEVMGLTGVAFILQVDTSGPYADGELDCAWWPNDAWGFDMGLPVLARAAGREMGKVRSDPQAFRADPAAEYARALAPAIEASLRAGRPVLAEHDHGFIVLATDGGDPPVMGYGTQGKSTELGGASRPSCPPWGAVVLGERTAPADASEADLAALCHVADLYHERAQGPEAPATRFSGRRAWAEWLRLLRDGSACDNNLLIHLRYGRRSAVAFLREMAGRHPGEAARHLTAAADLYQQVLDEAMAQELPWSSLVKGGEAAAATRAAYTAMVERVAGLEARAVAELEATASCLAGDR